MARTITEIYDEMEASLEAESVLGSGGTNPLTYPLPKTSVTRIILYICAVAIKVIEDLYDVFEDRVDKRKAEIMAGTSSWYANESLLFQYGDSLAFQDSYVDEDGETVELIGKNVVYPVLVDEDDSKRVVDLAAADELNGSVVIKAAKIVAGTAQKLSAAELSAFTSYWQQKRFAGTTITIVSTDPDDLLVDYTIKVDATVIDPTTGESKSVAGTYPVEDAIDDFLQTYQGENFAGDMQVMKLTSAIEAVSGVKNAVANSVEAKTSVAVSYTDVLAISDQTYTADAGYMTLDGASTLTYTS